MDPWINGSMDVLFGMIQNHPANAPGCFPGPLRAPMKATCGLQTRFGSPERTPKRPQGGPEIPKGRLAGPPRRPRDPKMASRRPPKARNGNRLTPSLDIRETDSRRASLLCDKTHYIVKGHVQRESVSASNKHPYILLVSWRKETDSRSKRPTHGPKSNSKLPHSLSK